MDNGTTLLHSGAKKKIIQSWSTEPTYKLILWCKYMYFFYYIFWYISNIKYTFNSLDFYPFKVQILMVIFSIIQPMTTICISQMHFAFLQFRILQILEHLYFPLSMIS